MTTHMESNRQRIAKVRAENIARQERKAKRKPKAAASPQERPPVWEPSRLVGSGEYMLLRLPDPLEAGEANTPLAFLTTSGAALRVFYLGWHDGGLAWYEKLDKSE
jgi:hypothetical protein